MRANFAERAKVKYESSRLRKCCVSTGITAIIAHSVQIFVLIRAVRLQLCLKFDLKTCAQYVLRNMRVNLTVGRFMQRPWSTDIGYEKPVGRLMKRLLVDLY